ncbi:MAG: hypothetical protein J5823_02605, partial [Paludibacteraceae bacterium]|nr:hypothetical protein [Paludibacteraceae bacterium]
MKKFFSFFAAVLFAGSMMAADVVFSGADFTGGTADTGSAFTITKNGVTVSSDKAYGTGSELRVYATGKLNVSATATITKIAAEFSEYTKMTFDDATPNATTWSIDATKQIRVTKLTVTIDGEGGGEGGQGGEGGEGGQVAADTLTCAQAAEQALAGKTDEVIIKGYVTEMVEEWSSFKNVSFWMSDTKGGANTFEAFRVKCETAAEAPTPGALVWVKGKLTKYTKN